MLNEDEVLKKLIDSAATISSEEYADLLNSVKDRECVALLGDGFAIDLSYGGQHFLSNANYNDYAKTTMPLSITIEGTNNFYIYEEKFAA